MPIFKIQNVLSAAIVGGLLVAGINDRPVQAAAAEIKFAFPATPKSPLYGRGMVPWAKQVSAASGGTLNVKTIGGPVLGTFRNIYDRMLKGVTDIAFSIMGPYGGKFPKSMLTGLPFESKNVKESALAFYRLYANGTIAKEYSNVKVLALFHFPHAGIHTNKPIKTIADLKNMKLAITNRLQAQIAAKLGSVGVSMTPPSVYQAMNRRTVGGTLLPWTGLNVFKVYEVTKYHLEGAFSAPPAFVLMNKKSYDGLPSQARKAIDAASGEVFTRKLSGVITGMANFGRKKVKGLKGHTVSTIKPADQGPWIKAISGVNAASVKRVKGGDATLKAFRAEIKKIRQGK